MKPAKIGTVWTAQAKIQIIDEATNKWRTLAVCIDTPNAIEKAPNKCRKPGLTLWVNSDVNGRYIP